MAVIATVTLNPALDIAASAPEVAPTIKVRCSAPSVQAGGGGINVARVAERFGAEAHMVFLAGGATGERLTALLRAETKNASAIASHGDTRESFTVTDARTHEQFRFVFPGPAITESEAAAVVTTLAALEPAPNVIVFSGSIPAGLPPTFGAQLAGLAQKTGARTVVDGPADLLAATRGAYLIKPNERELGALAGRTLARDGEVIAAAREAIRAGIAQNVLVSMGERGALLVSEAEALHYGVPPVTLVSAVGAGDSMVGALTASLAAGTALEDAVLQGAAAGSAALLTPGTDLCWAADAARLLPEITRTAVTGGA